MPPTVHCYAHADDSRLCLALRIVFQHTFNDFDTLVGRAVVHKDDIQIPIRLFKYGAGAPLDIILDAIDGYEDADLIGFLCHNDSLYMCFDLHS